jgi:rubrerythrin
MAETLSRHLSEAYAAASLAAARLEVFALKAEAEGLGDAARRFSAAAASAAVHARRFMRVLRGRIGTTGDNLEEALDGLFPELVERYGRAIDAPDIQGSKVATEVFTHARRVTGRMDEWLREGSGEGPVHVCRVCGWIASGGAPERCPVCNAVRSRFRAVGG